jgi:proteasome lid subunit RPN8/RPN11
MKLNETIIEEIKAHVNSSPKQEICGLIVADKRKYEYVKCRNISHQRNSFIIHPEDYANAEDSGSIICCVHSHLYESPNPSQADLIELERNKLPYLIMNYPINTYTITEPTGYEAPYEGRQFVHGITDCFSLFHDYYRREFGVVMQEYRDRMDEWWKKGYDLIKENYESEGLVRIEPKDLQKGDVIFISTFNGVTNHCAIYLGDDRILHHLSNRLSKVDVYGGYWRKNTNFICRHRSQFKD